MRRSVFARCFVLVLVCACLQARAADPTVVQTVAGGGVGDGDSATSAILFQPLGTATDAAGNVYIADAQNNRIRKVATNGIITTVAGNGVAGYSGDGGAATNAELSFPSGVSIDGAGDLYIADQGNNRIRAVTPDGTILTIAGNGTAGYSGDGGAATNAELSFPSGVAIDGAGNLYIADSQNNRIRKVAAGVLTPTITTVAGNGTAGYAGDGGGASSAELSYPYGLAFDATGNLYIADSGNSVVRKVATNSTITTVAGNGTEGYSGDGGAATSAELDAPISVTIDGVGNLYIADNGNNRIRKVASGKISTIAGNGTAGYSGDGGAATSAELDYPAGVAIDGTNNLYIADNANHVVRKVTSGNISTFAGINGNTSGFTGDGGPATGANLTQPTAITFDSTGNLYITDNVNNRIRQVATNGIITTVASVDSPSAVATPDGTDTLFVGGFAVINIVPPGGSMSPIVGTGFAGYSGDGGPAIMAEISRAGGMAIDKAGNLYFSDVGNNCIRKVDTHNIITTVAGNGTAGYSGDGGAATSAELNEPVGVAIDGAGNLYVADNQNNRIRKISTNGTITTVAGNGTEGYSGDGGAATNAELFWPSGVAIDNAGDLYIADTFNNRIRKVANGIITTVAGNGGGGYSGDGGPATSAEFSQPRDVAFDNAGNLYIADFLNNRIRVVLTVDAIFKNGFESQ
jgi:hypothetical protein